MSNKPVPSHEESALALLDTAKKAALKVNREERGGLLRWWQDRQLTKFLRLQEDKCRHGDHYFTAWRLTETACKAYAPGDVSHNQYPVRVFNMYQGACRYCGAPTSRSVTTIGTPA